MAIGKSTASLQFHRRFSSLFKSWYLSISSSSSSSSSSSYYYYYYYHYYCYYYYYYYYYHLIIIIITIIICFSLMFSFLIFFRFDQICMDCIVNLIILSPGPLNLEQPQLLKWNGSETRQTPLLYVFVSFFGPDHAQRSIAFLYHFELTDQQKHCINLFSHNL